MNQPTTRREHDFLGEGDADVAEALGNMNRAEMNALLVPERLTQPIRLVELRP